MRNVSIANSDTVSKCDNITSHVTRYSRRRFVNFMEHISKMDVLFGSSFSALEDAGRAFTRCGLTRRYLQYIAGPPARLYNRHTETVYPLPVGGNIKQWSGRVCPYEECR